MRQSGSFIILKSGFPQAFLLFCSNILQRGVFFRKKRQSYCAKTACCGQGRKPALAQTAGGDLKADFVEK
ncbi:MAG: hypothetical protein DU429_01215 [Candidatus Tokpelaia sp.]|nr:MAG: hypothetical protein DU430_02845 [Candidatus Tokpelaia sp.]KAA6207688.1 MAG: hypothetical protein DU429_01215 [Candidatus Tokpelaia sp.]